MAQPPIQPRLPHRRLHISQTGKALKVIRKSERWECNDGLTWELIDTATGKPLAADWVDNGDETWGVLTPRTKQSIDWKRIDDIIRSSGFFKDDKEG